jgi:hypothetical protein
LQAQHDRLGFRVTKATVVFDDFGCTLCVNHQPGIEEAGIGMAFTGHAVHGGLDHFAQDACMHLGCDHRCWAVRTHAASIGAAVAIAHALVILTGGHGQNVFAINHDDEAGFFAFEEFFNDDTMPGFAKGITGEHVTNRRLGFGFGHRNDHTFACG